MWLALAPSIPALEHFSNLPGSQTLSTGAREALRYLGLPVMQSINEVLVMDHRMHALQGCWDPASAGRCHPCSHVAYYGLLGDRH